MTRAPQPCQEIPVEQMSGGVLAVQMINVHWRQVLHLLLRDTELDTVIDPGHGADRDGDFLAAPQVTLLQQHVGHVVVGGVDDQALDSPDVAVGGMDVLAAADLHFVQGTLS